MKKRFEIIPAGSGGGKGGGGTSYAPTEAKNNLACDAIAKVLDLISEGPIHGLASGAQSIFLDDTPLQNASGTYNFKGVTWEDRKGFPDQAPLSAFTEAESEVMVSTEVTHALPVTRTIEPGDFDHIRLTFYFPALMFQDPKTGDISGTGVDLHTFVKAAGKTFVKAADTWTSGKTNRPYMRSIMIRNLKANYGDGPWEVQVQRITEDSAASNMQNKTYWQSYTTVLAERFSYPDMALVGMEIDAKQFGSNLPTRSYDVKGRNTIKIPSNYNPVSRTYTGVWDGTFTTAWTDNPAWIFYDLLTNTRYGLGQWIGDANVDKWALYAIGKYCDGLVPNGYGKNEPRLTCNAYLQTQEDAFHLLNALASAFYAMPFWSSGLVTLSQDKPTDPTHLASPANVIGGHFNYSGAGLASKSSVVFVTWNDPDDAYRSAIELVEDPELIAKYGWKQKDVLATGCTRRSQARRFGRWILDNEKNAPETVAFAAGLDFADAVPGSVVKVADPSYQGVRFGGRLAAGPDSLENLLKYSGDFSQSSVWTATECGLTDAGENSGPLPETRAVRMADTGVGNYHRVYQSPAKPSVAASYTLSVFVKPETCTRITLRLGGSVNPNYCDANFNLASSVLVSSSQPGNCTFQQASISPLSNGWYRLSLTVLLNADAVARAHILMGNGSGLISYAGSGATVLVFGAQLEKRACAGEYCETRNGYRNSEMTTTNLPLDAPVTLDAGETYTLSVVLPDKSVEEKTVTSPAGLQGALAVSPAFSQVPLNGAMWVLSGSNCAPRLFRVIANQEPEPGRFEITALLHDPNKYARVERDLVLEETPASTLPTGEIVEITGLEAKLYTYVNGRNFATAALLSWDHSLDPRVVYYDVDRKYEDGSWVRMGETQDCSIEAKGLKTGTWSFRIRGRGVGTSRWAELNDVGISDPNFPPPDVTGLQVFGGGATYNGKECEVLWTDVVGQDYFPAERFNRYKLQILTTANVVKRTVYPVDEKFVYTNAMILRDFGAAPRSFKVRVWAQDSVLRLSTNYAELTVTKSSPTLAGYSPTVVQAHTGVAVDFSSASVASSDVAGFKIYMDENANPTTLKATVASEARSVFLHHDMSRAANLKVKIVPFDDSGDGTASSIPTLAVNKAFYVDPTTGKAFAGNGNLVLDATGFTIFPGANPSAETAIKFDPGDGVRGQLYMEMPNGPVPANYLELQVLNKTGEDRNAVLSHVAFCSNANRYAQVYLNSWHSAHAASIAVLSYADHATIEMSPEIVCPKIYGGRYGFGGPLNLCSNKDSDDFIYLGPDRVTAYDEAHNRLGINNPAPSYTLDVSGEARIDGEAYVTGGLRLAAQEFVRHFGPVSFTNGVADQKVDLTFGTSTASRILHGFIEVTVVGAWNTGNGYGHLTKRFAVVMSGGTISVQSTRYVDNSGATATHFAISDITWDATNQVYKVQIANIASSGVSIGVIARFVSNNSYGPQMGETAILGSIYTTDPTVFPAADIELAGPGRNGGNLYLRSAKAATKGKIYFGDESAYDELNKRLGIGVASPAYPLDVNGSVNVPAGAGYLVNGSPLISDRPMTKGKFWAGDGTWRAPFTPGDVDGGSAGNIDGGTANTNYGNMKPIDGGSA